jgi:hypothetical protein
MNKVLNFKTLSTVAAATLFLFSQFLVLVAAIVGLAVNLFGLEVAGILVCLGIAAIPSIAVLILIARMVYLAETDHVA